MSGSALSALQQCCSPAAGTSAPARVIPSAASRAAASLFSPPYPAALQSPRLRLRVRNMELKMAEYCERLTVKRPPTGTRLSDGGLAFLPGDEPVHLVEHSVNL